MRTKRHGLSRLTTIAAAAVTCVVALHIPLAGSTNAVVLGENGTVIVVDDRLQAVLATIPVPDPDGTPGTPNTPVALEMSTVPGQAGRIAYVFHEDGIITPVDIVGRFALPPVPLISTLGPVTIVDAAAAESRRLIKRTQTAVTTEIVNYLHVLGRTIGGDAIALVVRQDRIGGTGGLGGPLIVQEIVLGSPFEPPLGLATINTPAGDQFQRVIYQVGRIDALGTPNGVSTLVYAAGRESANRFQRVRETTEPATSHTRSVIGVPFDRELPITRTDSGDLLNIDTGGRCTVSPNVEVVSVRGTGPNAYNLLALAPSEDRLYVVDPRTCDMSFVPTPANPSAITPTGNLCWDGAWIANRDDDSISRLRTDGTLAPAVSLMPPTGPIRRANPDPCTICPIDMDLAANTCTLANVDVSVGDFVADSQLDVRFEVDPVGCPATTQYLVKCQCILEVNPDCACACECDEPDCECGAFALINQAPRFMLFGPMAIALQPDWPIAGVNPWKKLGVFDETPIDLPDAGEDGDDVVYSVEPIPD